jgi:hypothetical protein
MLVEAQIRSRVSLFGHRTYMQGRNLFRDNDIAYEHLSVILRGRKRVVAVMYDGLRCR